MSLRPTPPPTPYSGNSPIYSLPYPTIADTLSSTFKYSASAEARKSKTIDQQIQGAMRGFSRFDKFTVYNGVYWLASTSIPIVVSSGLGVIVDRTYGGKLDNSLPTYFVWSGLSTGLVNHLYVGLTEEDQSHGVYNSTREARDLVTSFDTTGDCPGNSIEVAQYYNNGSGVQWISTVPQEQQNWTEILLQHIANSVDPHGSTLQQSYLYTSGLTDLGNLAVTGNATTFGNVTTATFMGSLTASGLSVNSIAVPGTSTIGTLKILGAAGVYGAPQFQGAIVPLTGITLDGRDISTDGQVLTGHITSGTAHGLSVGQISGLAVSGGCMTGVITCASGVAVAGVDFSTLQPLYNGSLVPKSMHWHSAYSTTKAYDGIAPHFPNAIYTPNPNTETASAMVVNTAVTESQQAYYGTTATISNLKGSWLLNDFISGTCIDNANVNHWNIFASGVGMTAGPNTRFPVTTYFNTNVGQCLWCPSVVNQQLQGASAFTISCWVKFNTLPVNGVFAPIICKWTTAPPTGQVFSTYVRNAAGTYTINLSGSTNGTSSTSATYTWSTGAPPNLQVGSWYHLVFQGTGSVLRIKVNNGSWQGNAAFTTALYAGTYPMTIGTWYINTDGTKYSQTGTATIDAAIACVNIWNSALSDADVTTLYANTMPMEWSQMHSDTQHQVIGQTFVPHTTGAINSVQVTGHRIGASDFNTVCNIHATSAGTPTTVLGASAPVSSVSSWPTAEGALTYTFSPTVNVTSGVPLAFAISGIGPSIGTNYLAIRRDFNNSYSSGASWYQDNSGVWHPEALPNRDLVFTVNETNTVTSFARNVAQYQFASGINPTRNIVIPVNVPPGAQHLDSVDFYWENYNTGYADNSMRMNVYFGDCQGALFYPDTLQNLVNFDIGTTSSQTVHVSDLGAMVMTYGTPWKVYVNIPSINGDTSYNPTSFYNVGDMKFTYNRY